MTEADAVKEAQIALAPFSLEIQKVDWWTAYSIKQSVAETFFAHERVFLAGDAAHLHSSAMAQGMNTGIHDAVNLGWKLGGYLTGLYDKSILETYATERHPAALELIRLDKAFATMISGQVPDEYVGMKGDVNGILTKIFDEQLPFTTGLGILYDKNAINRMPTYGNLQCGWRCPDGLLYSPGSQIPQRLQQLTRNKGLFYVVVFAGQPHITSTNYQTLQPKVSASAQGVRRCTELLTIIAGNFSLAESVLGVSPIGRAFYDREHTVHLRYGMSTTSGGIAVLRPDGLLGYAAALTGWDTVVEYFEAFVP